MPVDTGEQRAPADADEVVSPAAPSTPEPTADPTSPSASVLAIALAVPERLAVVESHVQRLEEALLFLASEVGKQRAALTADLDDIVAHQSLAIRRSLEEILDRLPRPEEAPAEAPTDTRRDRRAKRRELRRHRRHERQAARRARRSRRRQLLVPSLFLLAGLAGGAVVGVAPYTAADERCQGPLGLVAAQVRGAPAAPPEPELCAQASSDRMLLATVPALGGVMAAVAIVVMSDGARPARPRDLERSAPAA